MLVADQAWLVGLGAMLAGAGSFLSGLAALTLARKKGAEDAKKSGDIPPGTGPSSGRKRRVFGRSRPTGESADGGEDSYSQYPDERHGGTGSKG